MNWSWKWAIVASVVWFAVIQIMAQIFYYPSEDQMTAAGLGWLFILGICVICFLTVRKYYKVKKKLEEQQRLYPMQPQQKSQSTF